MDAIIGILQVIGTFAVGLAARLGVVLLAMGMLLVPAALVFGALRAVEWGRRRARGLELAGGVRYRPDLHYATGHTWVRREKGEARVGVDDLAQRILPWAISVRLPKPGTVLRAGEPAAVISAGGQEATIAAPLDGVVTGVNGAVALDPALVKRDAYARGWLFQMKPASDLLDGGNLKVGPAAQEWLAGEGHRLHGWLETRLGIAAADGGEIVDPVASHLTPSEWKALTEAFLRG
jgi:glycine cleavage system H lipoate-binding protein